MIKTCRKTASVHSCGLYLTMNNGHLISNGTGTERSFWMWRRQKEEREKITIIPKHVLSCQKLCFLQPNPLVPWSEVFRLCNRDVDGRSGKMLQDLFQDCRSEEKILTFMRREKSCILGYLQEHRKQHQSLCIYKPGAQLWTEPVEYDLMLPSTDQ